MIEIGRYLAAFLYIFYGITKVIIGLSVMSLPTKYIAQIPVFKWFIKAISDKTFAGRFYEYVLLIFGFYTILHGLALFNTFPKKINNYIENPRVTYAVFEIFGIVLTVFYFLVIYTNLPIDKDKSSYNDYKLFGLSSGILFIILPILWEGFDYISPLFSRLSREVQSLILLSFIIILLFIIDLIYNYVQRRKLKVTPDIIVPADYQNAYSHARESTSNIGKKVATSTATSPPDTPPPQQ